MKTKYKIIIGVVILIIIIRLILPYIILHYANKTLSEMKGYHGHIKDLDLAVIRGAYTIKNIYLNKVDTATLKQTEFFNSQNIDLSIEWSALFKGSIVGELYFDRPALIFTQDKAEIGDIKKDSSDFRELLDNFMPLTVNRFEVDNGSIHYIDKTSKPKLDLSMTHVNILAQNLSNVNKDSVLLPSTVKADANVYEGTLNFNMKINPLAQKTTFDLNAEIKNTNLVLLNDFFKAYGSFDVNRGRFGMFTEMATKDGKFTGYVKPVIKDLDVVGIEDRKDSFFQQVWESVVGTVGVIFRNFPKDQVATKIPMEGNFKDPQISTLDAIWEVLKNAFIQALMPSIDNEIDIKSVEKENPKDERNLLERIFSSGKKKGK